MGLNEIESDKRGSGDKRIDQMITDELRWHMEWDKIGWDQMILYDIFFNCAPKLIFHYRQQYILLLHISSSS